MTKSDHLSSSLESFFFSYLRGEKKSNLLHGFSIAPLLHIRYLFPSLHVGNERGKIAVYFRSLDPKNIKTPRRRDEKKKKKKKDRMRENKEEKKNKKEDIAGKIGQ